MIVASAPGKVVLWGEYAVLEGAPAVVLAVNRYARCKLQAAGRMPEQDAAAQAPAAAPRGVRGDAGQMPNRRGIRPASRWRFIAQGFNAPVAEFEQLPASPPSEPGATLAWHVLRQFDAADLPPISLCMDTRAFFAGERKLGLGSSAALCVALEGAWAALAGGEPDYARALNAHRQHQGNRGSGIDVAASFFGGSLRLQDARPEPCPDALVHRCFIWVGEAAQTATKLDGFRAYLRRGERTALAALAQCSEQLCDRPSLPRLAAYAQALKGLDEAARLGIYSTPHLALEQLADSQGLIYKPCGAGGGDLGMAVAASARRLAPFKAAAKAAGFAILNLRMAERGIRWRQSAPEAARIAKFGPKPPMRPAL